MPSLAASIPAASRSADFAAKRLTHSITGGGAEARPQVIVVDEGLERRRHRVNVERIVDDEPGHAVDDRLARPTRTTGNLWKPPTCSFEEDNPEALCSIPPQRFEHSIAIRSAAPYSPPPRARVSDPKAGGRSRSGNEFLESSRLAARFPR
ncbi:MAG: hypothetical protein R2706_18280 [Acidimicrobiales bacterium]